MVELTKLEAFIYAAENLSFDFIINNDIKFRMGNDLFTDEDATE